MTGDTMALARKVNPGAPWFHWSPDKACAGIDPDILHPDTAAEERVAVQVCHPCVFKVDCGEWAYETRQVFGVAGGTTPRQRRAYFRRMDALANAGAR